MAQEHVEQATSGEILARIARLMGRGSMPTFMVMSAETWAQLKAEPRQTHCKETPQERSFHNIPVQLFPDTHGVGIAHTVGSEAP